METWCIKTIKYIESVYIEWFINNSNPIGACPDCGSIVFKRYEKPKIILHYICGQSKNSLKDLTPFVRLPIVGKP